LLFTFPMGLIAQGMADKKKETVAKSSVTDQAKVVDDPFISRQIKVAPKNISRNDIVEDFPGLKGYWIQGSSTSIDTLRAFNTINFAGTLSLLSSKQVTKEECKRGKGSVSEEIWDSLSLNEQDFCYSVGRLAMLRCKATKPIPVLPPVYLSALKRVEQLYAANSDKGDIYFVYPLLAMSYLIDGDENAARDILKKIKAPCGSMGTHSPTFQTGDCWKTFNEFTFKDTWPKIYTMLDDINEMIENHGVYYTPDMYNKLKLQSKVYKGTAVEFTITISDIYPGEKENYINGYVGSFSSEQQRHYLNGSSIATMYSKFDEETSNPNTSRITISAPPLLSEILSNLKVGDIITVKGKANGLTLWNEYVGHVPLVTAVKISTN